MTTPSGKLNTYHRLVSALSWNTMTVTGISLTWTEYEIWRRKNRDINTWIKTWITVYFPWVACDTLPNKILHKYHHTLDHFYSLILQSLKMAKSMALFTLESWIVARRIQPLENGREEEGRPPWRPNTDGNDEYKSSFDGTVLILLDHPKCAADRTAA